MSRNRVRLSNHGVMVMQAPLGALGAIKEVTPKREVTNFPAVGLLKMSATSGAAGAFTPRMSFFFSVCMVDTIG